jgi:hypothetical protein
MRQTDVQKISTGDEPQAWRRCARRTGCLDQSCRFDRAPGAFRLSPIASGTATASDEELTGAPQNREAIVCPGHATISGGDRPQQMPDVSNASLMQSNRPASLPAYFS